MCDEIVDGVRISMIFYDYISMYGFDFKKIVAWPAKLFFQYAKIIHDPSSEVILKTCAKRYIDIGIASQWKIMHEKISSIDEKEKKWSEYKSCDATYLKYKV